MFQIILLYFQEHKLSTEWIIIIYFFITFVKQLIRLVLLQNVGKIITRISIDPGKWFRKPLSLLQTAVSQIHRIFTVKINKGNLGYNGIVCVAHNERRVNRVVEEVIFKLEIVLLLVLTVLKGICEKIVLLLLAVSAK